QFHPCCPERFYVATIQAITPFWRAFVQYKRRATSFDLNRNAHCHLLSSFMLLKTLVLNDSALWKSLNKTDRLTLIAGPCVIESEKLCLQVASALKTTCARLGIVFVFKASYDK